MASNPTVIPTERIERSILLVRGHKVLLDSGLADLYGVETRVLVQAVRRNRNRFPDDFMFQLTKEEFADLKSQSVMSSSGWGAAASLLTRLPSRALLCFPVCCEASGLSK